MGSLKESMGGLSNGFISDPTRPPYLLQTRAGGVVEKSPYKVASKQLEIDDNIKSIELRTHQLALK